MNALRNLPESFPPLQWRTAPDMSTTEPAGMVMMMGLAEGVEGYSDERHAWEPNDEVCG